MPKNLPPKAWTRADIAQELHEYVYDEHKIVVDVAVGIAVGFAAQSLVKARKARLLCLFFVAEPPPSP